MGVTGGLSGTAKGAEYNLAKKKKKKKKKKKRKP